MLSFYIFSVLSIYFHVIPVHDNFNISRNYRKFEMIDPFYSINGGSCKLRMVVNRSTDYALVDAHKSNLLLLTYCFFTPKFISLFLRNLT